MKQTDFFDSPVEKTSDHSLSPLAFRCRPQDFSQFFGQQSMLNRYKFLKSGENLPASMIFWGPPGSGKTTLAYLVAKKSNRELHLFNAVLSGVPELRKIIQRIIENFTRSAQKAILFIDEIHRFNKSQQDALLPHIEAGDFWLIGATTENPRSCLNKAILSRSSTIELSQLEHSDIKEICQSALRNEGKELKAEVIEFISQHSGGDARKALNSIETILNDEDLNSLNAIKKQVLENSRVYDKTGDRHYDVISAFIKSMRGSNPDAALLWLAVMLDGGEDPVFIARRLIIFASEDIGNADPAALSLATSTLIAVQNIGMPEARINLAQAVSYLASTYKSNAAYLGISKALSYVQNCGTIDPPDHLKNHPPNGSQPYKYPHDFPNHFVQQQYSKEDIPQFYLPTEQGRELGLKQRLQQLKHQIK